MRRENSTTATAQAAPAPSRNGVKKPDSSSQNTNRVATALTLRNMG